MSNTPLNILCISTYFKGEDFLKACKAEGNNVYLLTKKSLKDEKWPMEAITEMLVVEDEWNDEYVRNGIAYKFRSIKFDRFVALDDFDVEHTAKLREHFRMPGMGDTTARYFRDKLAMRFRAQEAGIPVPAFTALFNDESIARFAHEVPAPWMLKPRFEASAKGIQKIHSSEQLWKIVHELGDDRNLYLVERFAPGDVYHVDGLNFDGKVAFSRVSQYLDTPFEVAHGGGIFRSQTIEIDSAEDKELTKLNKDVMKAFGMQFGASHTEFIRSRETGEAFFVETSCRVGGANLAEMVEIASGINLWGEWAKIESASLRKEAYKAPKSKKMHAGIIVSLSRYEHPDTASFNDAEVSWRMNMPWHIGMIVTSKSKKRVLELLDKYAKRIEAEFHASGPAVKASDIQVNRGNA